MQTCTSDSSQQEQEDVVRPQKDAAASGLWAEIRPRLPFHWNEFSSSHGSHNTRIRDEPLPCKLLTGD
ncbi:Protein Prrc1 [Manis pentadactyla]|nr:Protein Prrc1 [Manis pentadactyla]